MTYRIRALLTAALITAGVLLVPTGAEAAGTTTFLSTADTWVAAGQPSTAFGAQASMRTDNAPAKIAYVQFAPTVPAGETVTSAVLRLYTNANGPRAVSIYQVAGFTEATTYDTRPALGALVATGTLQYAAFADFTVTSAVTGGTVSFAVVSTAAAVDTYISTRESFNDPQLVVTTSGGSTGGPVQPGTVGFLGDPSTLHVINSAATAAQWAPGSYWYAGGQLRVDTNSLTLDGVYCYCTIDYRNKSGTLTIKNSIIRSVGMGWAVILTDSGESLNISDSDIVWPASASPPGSPWSNACVHGDANSTLLRNDISGCPDGVQQAGGNSTYDSNHIHDLALLGTFPNNTHNDGIQLYGGPNEIIRNNYIETNPGGGYEGHQNAAVFLSDDGASHVNPIVQNNYLAGGGYIFRLEKGSGAVVTDNQFGCICGGFGYAYISPGATVAQWGNNTNPSGGTIPKP